MRVSKETPALLISCSTPDANNPTKKIKLG
jgi:hypothetical protein